MIPGNIRHEEVCSPREREGGGNRVVMQVAKGVLMHGEKRSSSKDESNDTQLASYYVGRYRRLPHVSTP